MMMMVMSLYLASMMVSRSKHPSGFTESHFHLLHPSKSCRLFFFDWKIHQSSDCRVTSAQETDPTAACCSPMSVKKETREWVRRGEIPGRKSISKFHRLTFKSLNKYKNVKFRRKKLSALHEKMYERKTVKQQMKWCLWSKTHLPQKSSSLIRVMLLFTVRSEVLNL